MQKKEKYDYVINNICNKMLSDWDAMQKKYASFYLGKLDKEWMSQIQFFFQITKKAWIKRFFINIFNAPFFLKNINRKFINKKYIFVGLRYKELLNGLPRDEMLIIARSKSDMAYALKNKIAFIASQNITYYFLKAYFEGKTESLKNEMYKFFKLFSLQQAICYLILTSDSKPDDLFFSSLACHFNGMFRVLYVQHGVILNFIDDEFLVFQGERTLFNLLYDESQREIALKYIKNSELLVMGPPWNLPCVMPQGNREVILVGTDEGSPFYDIFQELSKLLKAANVNHTYRPHPADNNTLPDELLHCIDARTKEDLLSGKPKIFVGFVSTLLFEAYICGHTVYSIVYDKHFAKCNFDVDGFFNVEELPVLCSTIVGQPVVRKRMRDQNTLLPLSERFMKAINDIEHLIAMKKNGGINV